MDLTGVFTRLRRAMALREKYTPCASDPPVKAVLPSNLPPLRELRFEFRDGLGHVVHSLDGTSVVRPLRSVQDFYTDMAELFAIRSDGSVGTFCFQRLRLLQTKFDLYMMANFDQELQEQMSVSHRDFYNVRKVDTHIHHSAAMNAKHLLRFIKKKMKRHGDDVVLKRNGKDITLQMLCNQLGINAYDLSLDHLNVTADQTVFHRFDRFNQKYSPLNQPDLRTVFLKTDNIMGGRYLAEITRELLDDLEESKYQHAEWRLSIYGRSREEWRNLARWVLSNKLLSPNNRWMIQVPRLYSVYKATGQISSFQDMLDNIFVPLFEATLDPESHPEVAEFLNHISGFDSVDDESKSNGPGDRTFSSVERTPPKWDIAMNPSYKYYNFYLQSNIRTLNRLRAALGRTQFHYRPHAGEAGELHHLDTAFLLADGVSHGLNLRKSMPLQYLYYLCGIGIAMSPCSNNNLFLSYQKTPFHEFFTRGLNISLSTDDPLMFHKTKEPLMEEYSLAKQFFRLSSGDLCELARNSVLQSGFPVADKNMWLGSDDPQHNEILKTNLPNCRFAYRSECHAEEMHLVLQDDANIAMTAYRNGIPVTRFGENASFDAPSRALKRSLTEVAVSNGVHKKEPHLPPTASLGERLLVAVTSNPRTPLPRLAPEAAEEMELDHISLPPTSPALPPVSPALPPASPAMPLALPVLPLPSQETEVVTSRSPRLSAIPVVDPLDAEAVLAAFAGQRCPREADTAKRRRINDNLAGS
mmetsp:Transcript_101251/g.201180  ORF Transcript_101251/g.201180 Transcript_101251/m.201180 type:complete len:753 (+) Transcript_101251:3-2261(+)